MNRPKPNSLIAGGSSNRRFWRLLLWKINRPFFLRDNFQAARLCKWIQILIYRVLGKQSLIAGFVWVVGDVLLSLPEGGCRRREIRVWSDHKTVLSKAALLWMSLSLSFSFGFVLSFVSFSARFTKNSKKKKNAAISNAFSKLAHTPKLKIFRKFLWNSCVKFCLRFPVFHPNILTFSCVLCLRVYCSALCQCVTPAKWATFWYDLPMLIAKMATCHPHTECFRSPPPPIIRR